MKWLQLALLICLFACSRKQESDGLVLNSFRDAVIGGIDHGDSYAGDFKFELKTTPNNLENAKYRSKLVSLLNQVNHIDTLLLQTLNLTNEIRRKIFWHQKEFKILKENVFLKRRNSFSCVNYDYSLLNSTSSIIDPSVISGNISECSKKLNKLLKALIAELGTYDEFFLRFQQTDDLATMTEEHFIEILNKNSINMRDDGQVIKDLFFSSKKALTLTENLKTASVYKTLLLLQSIDLNLVSVRYMALAHIASKRSYCGYGFTKIMAMTTGPNTSNSGDTAVIAVFMGAFDEYNDPIVTSNQNIVAVSPPKDGIIYLKYIVKPGSNKFSGTVSIKNKSGVSKTENWTHSIYGKN